MPRLIEQVRRDPTQQPNHPEGPWVDLWSSLCHQGDVYEASYAALPHLVDIACSAEGSIDFSFFLLPACIEVARENKHGPMIPEYLDSAYFLAITRLGEAVALHRNDPWDQAMLLSAMSAQAVSKGHHRVAEVLINLDNNLIEKLIALDFDY